MAMNANDILTLTDEEFSELEAKLPNGQVTEEDLPADNPQETSTETQENTPSNEGGATSTSVETTEDKPIPGTDSGSQTESTNEPEINYEEAYKKIMAPFKANGTTFNLKSPEEVIALMQKGANYTSKMQQIAPQRKLLKMLEKNNLLDQDKLELLIEVQNKNPEAIKKFMKDNSIDPMDIDTNEESKYEAGKQIISDKKMAFESVLDDLQEMEDGISTMTELQRFDEQSQNILWEYPETMREIHMQRKSGVYDLISNEVRRQKVLGTIPENTPFLVAYKNILDAQQKQPQMTQTVQQPTQSFVQPQQQQFMQPIARGGMPNVTNNNVANKVKAAAPTKAAPAKVTTQYKNPFAMSDEEIERMNL